MSLLLALLLAVPANEAIQYRFDVTIYRGTPGGTKEKGQLETLSKPTMITTNGQTARIEVGQSVPVVSDIQIKHGAKPSDAIIQKAMIVEQVGISMSVTATEQPDGTVFLYTYVQAKELIKETDGTQSILERAIKVRRNTKLGEKVIVPLYNPADYVELIKQAGSDETQTIKKPYTGKEVWVEMVATKIKP